MLPYFQQIPVPPYRCFVNPPPINGAPPSGARPYIVPCPIDWLATAAAMQTGTGPLGVNFALGSLQTSQQFDALLSVVIDNRNNLRPVYLTFGDTGWMVECPPGVLRSYPILSNTFNCTAYCDHVLPPTDTRTIFYFSNVPSQIFEMNDVADNIANGLGSFGQVYAQAMGDHHANGIIALSSLNPARSIGASTGQNWAPTMTKASLYPYVTNTQPLVMAQAYVAGNVNPSFLPSTLIITSFKMSTFNVRVAAVAAISWALLLDSTDLYGYSTLFARPDYTGIARQTLFEDNNLYWATSFQNQMTLGANFWYGVNTNPFVGGYLEYNITYSMR